jgi:hypothetical protein
VTFEEFKKQYLKYDQRYDAVVYERKNKGKIHGDIRGKIYDKYSPVIIHTNLDKQQAHFIARLMNVEDEKYLKRVYDWLYPSKNIYGLHDD